MEPQRLPSLNAKSTRVIGLAFLLLIQVVMLVLLNVFEYSFYLPIQSGLTLRHAELFCGIYAVALLSGSIYAVWRFHWAVAAAQIAVPILLWFWPTLPERPYDPTKYQFLVGKTEAEVETILGSRASRGVGHDEKGSYVHYNGMSIYYDVAPDDRLDPQPDDRVISVERF